VLHSGGTIPLLARDATGNGMGGGWGVECAGLLVRGQNEKSPMRERASGESEFEGGAMPIERLNGKSSQGAGAAGTDAESAGIRSPGPIGARFSIRASSPSMYSAGTA